ncbi:putative GTP-binding protein 8 [Hypsibius exemplaris]|uniref:GTP-binding protein 8 n=1 Tax=Hypsibius exemplaris TaxID=2072580 RepID=A0A1W0W931_HYPEX|nr:putative GTP-binding protein 8 [Hypsibius exemplaris]
MKAAAALPVCCRQTAAASLLQNPYPSTPANSSIPASAVMRVKSVRMMSGQEATFRRIRHGSKPDSLLTAHPAADLYSDPCEKLQRLIEVPLFGIGTTEKPFRPTKAEMLQAQEVFTSRKARDIRRIDNVVDCEKAPLYHLPEVAFMGRSNVGKSSLIRAIFHSSPYVKVPVSKIAGFTKTLRFYQVKEHFTLVDMPGYGENQPTYFKECVEDFLQHRRNLRLVYLLIDGDKGFLKLDLEMLKYLEICRLYYCIVLNKIDLVNETTRLKTVAQIRQIREEYGSPCCFPQPFLVSSKTGEGLAYIQSFIAHITSTVETNSTDQKLSA